MTEEKKLQCFFFFQNSQFILNWLLLCELFSLGSSKSNLSPNKGEISWRRLF